VNSRRLTRRKTAKLQGRISKEINPPAHDIKLEDLHPTYQVFASLIGIEAALIIGQELGGANIYLPKLDIDQMIAVRERNNKIIEEFNGSNHAELARKYHITDITVREILKKARAHTQPIRQ